MKLKNWIRRSFRNRVFATILVVTLVPLLLCDVVMMQVIVARAEHTQARQARAALDMLSQRFDEAAGQCGDTLEALATSTITRSVLRRTEPDSRLLYQFLYRSAAAVRVTMPIWRSTTPRAHAYTAPTPLWPPRRRTRTGAGCTPPAPMAARCFSAPATA